MRIKSLFVFAVVVAICVIAASPQAQAGVISVNFRSPDMDGKSFVTGNAGVIDAGNWTNTSAGDASITLTDLKDDTGTATTADLSGTTQSGAASVGGDHSTQNAHLFKAYVDTIDGKTNTFTITSIPYAQYDLYYYHDGGSTDVAKGIKVTVNSTAYYSHELATNFPIDGTASDFVEYHNTNESAAQSSAGGNYMHLTGLSGDLTILVDAPTTSGWSSPYRAATSGFQIVEVPEPALLWDAETGPDGAQDGGGTWIAGGNNWWDGEANVEWDNEAGTIATFGAAGGTGTATVTVDATGVTAGGITFNEGATYTIDGGKITLEGDATVEANVDASIESVIDAGTAVLTKTGDGTLELTGANTYSGVAVDGGTLVGYAGVGDTGSILGDVALSAGTNVTFNQGSDGAYGGKITGDGSVTKTGAGMLEVTSCDHDYTGGLTIRAGTLQVTGWLPMDSMTTVEAGGTLGGTGLVAAIDLLRGGTVAPGASVGILSADGAVTLRAGAAYEWEVADLDGVAGTDWDLLEMLGSDLIVSATPGDPFTIKVVSLNASGDPGTAGGTLAEGDSFVIVDGYGEITGFSADAFTVDTSAFANGMGGLEFVVAARGEGLYLDVVPEPATMALMALGGVGLLLKRRRSK